ncbi:MAG: hypothetical protein ABW086_16610 [Sedimenticola sp.]
MKLLLQHVPDRGEHLVCYYGWYSNRSRGERKEIELESMLSAPALSKETTEEDTQFSQAARSAWARLIKKVYKVDPLVCLHCGGEMRFMAVIEETQVMEHIMRHIRSEGSIPAATNATG